MGAGGDKLLLALRGKEIVAWTVQALDRCDDLDRLVLVASEHNLDRIASVLDRLPTRLPLELVLGGSRRQDSVRLALQSLEREPPELVLVHDGARPLVTTELVHSCLEAAQRYGAATCGLPLKDACKEVSEDGFVRRSLERARLQLIQTPQAFRFELLLAAHRFGVEPGAVVDDDAELVEMMGERVMVLAGDPRNIKVTAPEDLAVLEAHLDRAMA